MRILHLADLHLGKLLYDVRLVDDQRHVLAQARALARERAVDVVAISGDVYDRPIPPVEAVALLDEFLTGLVEDGRSAVVVIPGNHDGGERLAFGSGLFRERGVHIAPAVPRIEPVTLRDAHGPVIFYPVPFLTPFELRGPGDGSQPETFTDVFRKLFEACPPLPSVRTVCVAHCYAAGGLRDDETEERPLRIGGSEATDPSVFAPFTLTLLGHLHRPHRIAERCWYAGSPLAYSFSDGGEGKCFPVFEIDGEGNVSRESVPVVPLRRLRSVTGDLDSILASAPSDPARDDYLSVTLTDRGALFDAARKVREAYPNTLHVMRMPAAEAGGGDIRDAESLRRRTDGEVVSDFFARVSDGLTDAEREVIDALLDEMLDFERKGEAS